MRAAPGPVPRRTPKWHTATGPCAGQPAAYLLYRSRFPALSGWSTHRTVAGTDLPNDFTGGDGREDTHPERAQLPNHAAPVVCR